MKQFSVLVIGDSCDDEYIYGDCSRLNPEGPIPVLDRTDGEVKPGMAANVNANLRAFGIRTNLITQKEKIIKTRFIDKKSNYQLLRVDTTPEVTPLAAPQVKMAFMHGSYDAIVISDYDKGFIDDQRLRVIADNFNGPIFVDTKKRVLFDKKNVFFKINEKEYNLLDKSSLPNDENLIVTLGSKGVRWRGIIFQPKEVKVFDVCGAGDTFLAALVFHYLMTLQMQESIDFANRAAAISVEHPGTYQLTSEDLQSLK
jgi:bifunctional ADP-heptose synthase (sugar kinase/adenylyltransferase)